jgi:BirA family biotin operon repressor/biotin-[acetyl-CoA-carboxylase] ligase
MIQHLHLNKCDSTQDILKEQLAIDPIKTHLVSCEEQLDGRGRASNKWVCLPSTLCFSFNLSGHSILSLTAMELSLLICHYFKLKKVHLSLKWPNDIWNENFKKCGGILIQGSQNNLFAGIGLNLLTHDDEMGGIFEHLDSFDKKKWCLDLTEFVLKNRYTSSEDLRSDWLEFCGHLNRRVQITESEVSMDGIFCGIGPLGEALLETNHHIKSFYNGSLRLL